MRLPNGFGTIYQLSNAEHRRRPWVAKVTKDGKQKPLGYFRTYQEALAFLVDYNKRPEMFGSEITFEQVYNSFRNEHWPSIAIMSQFLIVSDISFPPPRKTSSYNRHRRTKPCFHRETLREQDKT